MLPSKGIGSTVYLYVHVKGTPFLEGIKQYNNNNNNNNNIILSLLIGTISCTYKRALGSHYTVYISLL